MFDESDNKCIFCGKPKLHRHGCCIRVGGESFYLEVNSSRVDRASLLNSSEKSQVETHDLVFKLLLIENAFMRWNKLKILLTCVLSKEMLSSSDALSH